MISHGINIFFRWPSKHAIEIARSAEIYRLSYKCLKKKVSIVSAKEMQEMFNLAGIYYIIFPIVLDRRMVKSSTINIIRELVGNETG